MAKIIVYFLGKLWYTHFSMRRVGSPGQPENRGKRPVFHHTQEYFAGVFTVLGGTGPKSCAAVAYFAMSIFHFTYEISKGVLILIG